MNALLLLPASLVLTSLLVTGTAAPIVPPVEENVALVMMKPGEKYLEAVAEDAQALVTMGQMAKDKSTNAQIKDFGATLVTDHNQALSDIRALASKKDITLPTDLDKRAAKHTDKLTTLSGEKFDKAFIKYIIEEHRRDRSKDNDVQDDLKDPEIKALSEKLESLDKQHLETAKKIRKSMKD